MRNGDAPQDMLAALSEATARIRALTGRILDIIQPGLVRMLAFSTWWPRGRVQDDWNIPFNGAAPADLQADLYFYPLVLYWGCQQSKHLRYDKDSPPSFLPPCYKNAVELLGMERHAGGWFCHGGSRSYIDGTYILSSSAVSSMSQNHVSTYGRKKAGAAITQ